MKEVEILVQVFEDKKKVLDKLKKFHFEGKTRVLDTYFYDPKRVNLKPKESGRLTECFRLRKKADKIFLAYKLDNFDRDGDWIYSDEHETEVADAKAIIKIIDRLGFKTLVEINNEKSIFIDGDYEIVLEDVKGLGLFLEVERLHVKNNENVPKIKKNLWKFIQSLGFDVSKELNVGKPELMLVKNLYRR